jgi:hypothetical protein
MALFCTAESHFAADAAFGDDGASIHGLVGVDCSRFAWLALIFGLAGWFPVTTALGSPGCLSSIIGESFMSSLTLLADRDAEMINGGWWNSYSFTSFSYKSVATNLTQKNTANNLGVGLFYGAGIATSEQLNLSSITSVIG